MVQATDPWIHLKGRVDDRSIPKMYTKYYFSWLTLYNTTMVYRTTYLNEELVELLLAKRNIKATFTVEDEQSGYMWRPEWPMPLHLHHGLRTVSDQLVAVKRNVQLHVARWNCQWNIITIAFYLRFSTVTRSFNNRSKG